MKGVTSWSFHPYRPFQHDVGDIYICRISPGISRFSCAWLPTEKSNEYTLYWRIRTYDTASSWETRTINGTSCTIENLKDETDYEFYVASGEKKSRIRLVRTGFVPGDIVVNYLHPEDHAYAFSGQYLCSPSLLRLPDGGLLASMDLFKNCDPQNLTLIFRSDDDGKTWNYLSELFPCFWGKLFLHRGKVYMLACSTENGDMLIGRSDDYGKTFGMPTVLLRGSGRNHHKGCHRNPQPLLEYKGRLWFEMQWGCWKCGGHDVMNASVPADADLLDAGNWEFSEPTPYNPNWPGTVIGHSTGNIEGNLLVAPNGDIWNVLRYGIENCYPSFGKALIMKIDPEKPEHPQEFLKVIDFPGNHSKFTIRYDELSGRYFSLVSYLGEDHPSGRNILSLISSPDLENWTVHKHIFDYRHLPENKVGFQYVDWFIEGDDMLCLSRTAFNNASNFHDANYSVFFRINNFRQLLTEKEN